MKNANICIFGDSIAWGAFDLEKGGWVERLKLLFMENIHKNWVEIYNLGISGKTSKNIIDRFKIETTARDCDIAIIAIGINDSCFIGNEDNNLIPEVNFKENIKKIYQIGGELKLKKILFIGLTTVDETLVNPYPLSSKGKSYKNNIILKYNSIIKTFCSENNLDFIELYDTLTMQDLSDGLHPNNIGHQKIAEKVYKHLINISGN